MEILKRATAFAKGVVGLRGRPRRWRKTTIPAPFEPGRHHPGNIPHMRRRRVIALTAILAIAITAACTTTPDQPNPSPSTARPTQPTRKVLVIAEENRTYDAILGSPDAPYLNMLATNFGLATRMDAGYPTGCPSLAAYILMTSGSTHGICDDDPPAKHQIDGANVFAQVAEAGREWRTYGESAPGRCAREDAGSFLVRHSPAPYYTSEKDRCRDWAVVAGTATAGPLRADIDAGALPDFGFLTPNACNDMHGAAGCPSGLVAAGDRWLRNWIPAIMAGPDYRAGRLTILIVWDEGDSRTNHIPLLVISPSTRRVRTDVPFDHCGTLRIIEDLLAVPPLRCAADAPSMMPAFNL